MRFIKYALACVCLFYAVFPAAAQTLIRVAQETLIDGVGQRDFDAHVEGVIAVWDRTSLRPGDVYSYGNPVAASWNGDLLDAIGGVGIDRSHLMFAHVAASASSRCQPRVAGLSLFWVHDRGADPQGNPDGGNAKTVVRVLGDTSDLCRAVHDGEASDTFSSNRSSPQEITFFASNQWLECCTDGFSVDQLSGNWTMEVKFADYEGSDPGVSVLTGLRTWAAFSADDTIIPLELEVDRTVALRPLAKCEAVAWPSDLQVCPGGVATFRVDVEGTGPFTYQWRFMGVPISMDDNPTAGTRALSIFGAAPGDAGSYDCMVGIDAGGCTSATSNAVALSICRADFNCDSAANSQDFFDFLSAFFAGDDRADFNSDGIVNSQDFFDFLGAFFTAC